MTPAWVATVTLLQPARRLSGSGDISACPKSMLTDSTHGDGSASQRDALLVGEEGEDGGGGDAAAAGS